MALLKQADTLALGIALKEKEFALAAAPARVRRNCESHNVAPFALIGLQHGKSVDLRDGRSEAHAGELRRRHQRQRPRANEKQNQQHVPSH